MADDLLGRPVSLVRTTRQRLVRPALDRRRELVRRAAQALESPFDRLNLVLFPGGHQESLPLRCTTEPPVGADVARAIMVSPPSALGRSSGAPAAGAGGATRRWGGRRRRSTAT